MLKKILNKYDRVTTVTMGLILGVVLSLGAIAIAAELPPLSNFDTGKVLQATDLKSLAQAVSNLQVQVASLLVGSGTPSSSRELLTTDRTYYVRTDGSDNNTGLSNSPSGAWRTLQHAADYIHQNADLNGQQVIVNVAPGNYTGGVSVSGPFIGEGPGVTYTAGKPVLFLGNTASPSSVVISPTGHDCFFAGGGANLLVAGFKCTTNGSGFALHAQNGGKITLGGAMDFGAMPAGYSHVYADFGGYISMGGTNYKISGNATWHVYAEDGGRILLNGAPIVTAIGARSFSNSFVGVATGAEVRASRATYLGTFLGKRYAADSHGIIFASTGLSTHFPGTIEGTQTRGGIYLGAPDGIVYSDTTDNLLGAINELRGRIETLEAQN
jgi:hypothetical protein